MNIWVLYIIWIYGYYILYEYMGIIYYMDIRVLYIVVLIIGSK